MESGTRALSDNSSAVSTLGRRENGCGRGERRDLPWLSLPSHIQLAIASMLDANSLAKLLCTCQSWQRLLTAEDDMAVVQIWQSLCKEFLDPAQYALHVAFFSTVVCGKTKTDEGFFWRKLYVSARDFNSFTWWPEGGKRLKSSISDETPGSSPVACSSRNSGSSPEAEMPSPPFHPPDFALAVTNALDHKRLSPESPARAELSEVAMDLLSRVGHSSVVVKDLQLIVGGFSKCGEVLNDVIVIDYTRWTLSRPTVKFVNNCPPPQPRLRHTTTRITPSHEGHPRCLLIGGYNMDGVEFGAGETYTLTVLDGGKCVAWTAIRTTGEVPSPRFHHTADSLQDGQQVVLYGGEGSQVEDFVFQGPEPGTGLPSSASSVSSVPVSSQPPMPSAPEETPNATAAVVVYLLDVATFVWKKVPTTGPGPGPRSLHQSAIHRCSKTGHDRLVIVSGFSERRLMDMKAYALNLVTLQWTCKPWTAWGDLPPPRHRSASSRVGPDRMLFVGGCSPSSEVLNDILALDLQTMTWIPLNDMQATEPVHGSKMGVSGHTVNGLLVYGGCVNGPLGISLVPRLELMLIGGWASTVRPDENSS